MSDHGTMKLAAGTARRISRRAVSWCSSVVVGLLAVAIVALHRLAGSAAISTWWLGSLAICIGLGGSGSLIARRLPTNPIGWLMIAGGIVQGVVGVAREWSVYTTAVNDSLPGATTAAWIGSWTFMIPIASLPLVLLRFPDGRLLGARWRLVERSVVAATVIGSVTQALVPGAFTDDLPTLVNPFGIHWRGLTAIAVATELVLMVGVLASVVSLVARTRGAGPELRQQMKWVAFAATLLGVEVALELEPVPIPTGLLDWLGPVLLVFFLFAITVSVLRWHLWDIDAVINYSLVYGVLTVMLGGAYLGIVAISGRVHEHPVDYGSSLVAAGVVALAFAPARDRLQRLMDRSFFGDRSDPYRAVTRLGDRLGVPASGGSALDDVVDSIATSLRLDAVAIVAPDRLIMASFGSPRTAPEEIPLVFRATEVGTLSVARRSGAPLGHRETVILAGLAPLVGAIVHAVTVGTALQQSRRQLVTAREEERRRIRRDLHDGLGPALAAVRMKLDGARLLIDRDASEAKAVLDHLADDVRSTIEDIRRLVYDLRPPALDEIGLVSALREQARAFSGPTDDGYLHVEIDADGSLACLPAAVEVAVYRIANESLNNVLRHAHASHCLVSLHSEPGGDVHLVVDDDGGGCRATGRPGVGVQSMLERAAELGGTCRIERSPHGGTRVDARLPVAPAGNPVTLPSAGGV